MTNYAINSYNTKFLFKIYNIFESYFKINLSIFKASIEFKDHNNMFMND